MEKTKQYALIISGPTASGKSYLSEEIAKKINNTQIINADIGQFYKPLSIGTAKPNLKNNFFNYSLFDYLDTPKDFTAFEYSEVAKEKINFICDQKQLPIIVGGSLFYIKSLFFPQEKLLKVNNLNAFKQSDNKSNWELLNSIDPERAKQLHPNDSYRINRALEIWQKSGVKPSVLNPEYNPFFNSIFIFILPELILLKERISKRTDIMIFKDGWIDEAESLIKLGWEDFVRKKRLIGYAQLFDWIKNGKKNNDIDNVVHDIKLRTLQYAKKQIKFWKSFKRNIEYNQNKDKCYCILIQQDSCLLSDNIIKEVSMFLKNFCCR